MKGAIACAKRCFVAIEDARERMNETHAKVTEQFPALRTLDGLQKAIQQNRLVLVQGTEKLEETMRLTELADGCSLQDGNRMVLSWNVLVAQDNVAGFDRS